jgi:hypothetical protein
VKVTKAAAKPNKKIGSKVLIVRRPVANAKQNQPNSNKRNNNNNREPQVKLILQDKPNAGGNRPRSAGSNNNGSRQQSNRVAQAGPKPNVAKQNGVRLQQQQRVNVPKAAVVATTSSRGAARGGSVSELTLALQTANYIAINRSHPRQQEVVELLRTHEKGWVDDKKFIALLRGMIF